MSQQSQKQAPVINNFGFPLTIGDKVFITANNKITQCEYIGKIVGIANGMIALKHKVSKDSSRDGQNPWIGGEVEDTIDHIKVQNIAFIRKYND